MSRPVFLLYESLDDASFVAIYESLADAKAEAEKLCHRHHDHSDFEWATHHRPDGVTYFRIGPSRPRPGYGSAYAHRCDGYVDECEVIAEGSSPN